LRKLFRRILIVARLALLSISGLLLFAAQHTASAAARVRLVVYTSQCSCDNDHGVARWRAKTDRSEPPINPADIHPIVPSEIFEWTGPGIIPRGGGRTGNELRWFALTGRVISMGAESDGDVHLVLIDASGNKPGKVIVEMPLGPRWCDIRTTAFSWSNAAFPFTADWQHSPFSLVRRPVITVIGKAFYDTDHSGKDIRNNRRPRQKDKAVWEIHPVMKLQVLEPGDTAGAEPATATETDEEAPSTAPPSATSMPAPISTPTPLPVQFVVTLTKPVTLQIRYGVTTLPTGRQLTAVSHDDKNVVVVFEGVSYPIPISSTDLK
jgi:hypothetical protein